MIELKLPTMTCGHCVKTVTQVLHKLDPQATVDIDLASQQVRLQTSATEARVREVLDEEGYAPAPR